MELSPDYQEDYTAWEYDQDEAKAELEVIEASAKAAGYQLESKEL